MPEQPDDTRGGPFAGILIADLTHALCGPFCTRDGPAIRAELSAARRRDG